MSDHRPHLRSLLGEAVSRHGDRIAVVSDGKPTTYAELDRLSARVAAALVQAGVEVGIRVAILLPNCLEYLAVDLAIVRLGAVKVPLNEMQSRRDVDYCLTDSQAQVAIAGATLLPAVLASGSPHLRVVVSVDAPTPSHPARAVVPWDMFLSSGRPDASVLEVADAEDLGLVIYTGGTTGRPKGVQHTQGGLALNLLSHLVEMELSEDERMLLMSPLPHSAGFHAQAGLVKGATLYLERAFDPDLVLRRIAEDRVTFTFMVPTMIYRVLDAIGGRSLDLSALRTVLYGAAPITADRLVQGLALLGPVFVQLYGQSEAPNFITRLTRSDHLVTDETASRLRSCGRPVAMASVRIVAQDDPGLEPLPVGEVGELVASTPYTMTGYLGLPETTAATLVDGWLRTGDVGRMDEDGFVHLLDRKNDMIISGGMNVYSSEVETFISTVPGVAAVAVVGVPHPDWGEAVVACVVADGSVAVADLPASVRDLCRGELSAYKVPKEVVVVPELPLTTVGKMDKKTLRSDLGGDRFATRTGGAP